MNQPKKVSASKRQGPRGKRKAPGNPKIKPPISKAGSKPKFKPQFPIPFPAAIQNPNSKFQIPKSFQAGFSRACINPPIGMAMEGLKLGDPCTSIHDDLYVRALYLIQGDEKVLMISFDLLFFERAVIDRFKGALGRTLGLTPKQIFINTTHTHSGPRVSRWHYSEGPEALYLAQIEDALLAVSSEAQKRLRQVTLWAGKTQTDLPVSRRKLDLEGKAQWKPCLKSPVCNALPFCLLKDSDNTVLSILFSVSCHPSMMYESAISAEFPGAAMQELNAHFKTEGSFFLQGAAGDTKPRIVAQGEERWREGTWKEMQAVGKNLAALVIRAASKNMAPVEPDLKLAFTELAWPLQQAPEKPYYEAATQNPGTPAAHKLWAKDMLQQMNRRGVLPKSVPVLLHLIQFGKGLRLVGVEGEIVGELGLDILKIYNQGVTFPLGYTNGCQIYLTTTEMLAQGGYEVDSYWEYHYPAPLASNGERVLEAALLKMRDTGLIPNL